MSTSYCSMHLTDYPLGTMCPECRREQFQENQIALLDAQRESQEELREMREENLREAERRHQERLETIREAEHKRFNPGDYQCQACKLTTLLAGASRCPMCHADVAPGFWTAVYESERRARETAEVARKKSDDAARVARTRLENARNRVCNAAVATVKAGLAHTERLWEAAFQEAKRKHESQGFLSRMVAPTPAPTDLRKYRLQCTGFRLSETKGRWTTPPTLILGIVTLESERRLGFKHFRFPSPFEYIAVLRYLKTQRAWDTPEIGLMIAGFERVTGQDWPSPDLGDAAGDQDVAPDYVEILRRHRELAQRGDAASQRECGRAYANGQGVVKDYGEALSWYRKAAAQGDVVALRNIGKMHAHGESVSQDYGQALGWYRKAAALGDPEATRLIGFMYAYGQSVSQDYGQALEWYRKASALGDGWAQRNIAQMYHIGLGVIRDIDEAMKWYRAATAHSDAEVRLDAQVHIDIIGGKYDQ